MRQATPCPTVFSAPDQRLKTTPTFPGWMIVNDPQTAARRTTMSPSTTALASIWGALPRKSSLIGVPPFEAAVAATTEHDDARAPAVLATAERAREARLEHAAKRTQRGVEGGHEERQEDELAGADHRGRL